MTGAVTQQRALHGLGVLFLPAAQPLLQSASLSPFVPWMRKAIRLVQAAPDVLTARRAPGVLPGCDWVKWDWSNWDWSKWDSG